MRWADIVRKHRKYRQDYTQVLARLDLDDLPTSVVMPANARIGVRAIDSKPAGSVGITVNDGARVLYTPSLAPGQIHRYDWIERGKKLEVGPGLCLMLDIGDGLWVDIAENSSPS